MGPLGIVALALMVAILFAITLVLLLGAFLIWIPLVGLLVAAAIISSLLRAYFRQPRWTIGDPSRPVTNNPPTTSVSLRSRRRRDATLL
jgi:CHASE2 domain-containing sensor protein